MLKGQSLDRRIESHDRVVAEIDAWQVQRNQNGARIAWMFSTVKARTKMARAYPNPSLKESLRLLDERSNARAHDVHPVP